MFLCPCKQTQTYWKSVVLPCLHCPPPSLQNVIITITMGITRPLATLSTKLSWMTQVEQYPPFPSLVFIAALCNAASASVCAGVICHFCLHPKAFSHWALWLPHSSRRRLEAVRAITTWGWEWHLESDGWKGIKFSLEPTVWNWYSTLRLQQPLSPTLILLPPQTGHCINLFK